ncbi:hypothetical protein L208DRAFT_1379059 [Tricholoma matsutake]|nr:hypothetical protein L208DRAFT_1379059 [Tricholoma matsutake 945]
MPSTSKFLVVALLAAPLPLQSELNRNREVLRRNYAEIEARVPQINPALEVSGNQPNKEATASSSKRPATEQPPWGNWKKRRVPKTASSSNPSVVGLQLEGYPSHPPATDTEPGQYIDLQPPNDKSLSKKRRGPNKKNPASSPPVVRWRLEGSSPSVPPATDTEPGQNINWHLQTLETAPSSNPSLNRWRLERPAPSVPPAPDANHGQKINWQLPKENSGSEGSGEFEERVEVLLENGPIYGRNQFIKRLEALVKQIPESVPEGAENDRLAPFDNDPRNQDIFDLEGDELWEANLNHLLKEVFGVGNQR